MERKRSHLLISLCLSLVVHLFVLSPYFKFFLEGEINSSQRVSPHDPHQEPIHVSIRSVIRQIESKHEASLQRAPEPETMSPPKAGADVTDPKKHLTSDKVCSTEKYYYASSELHQQPKPKKSINRNPAELFSYQDSGVVKADLCIEDTGHVARVIITDSELPEVFNENVAEQFLKLSFAPGYFNGKNVPARISIKIVFQPLPPTTIVEKIPLVN